MEEGICLWASETAAYKMPACVRLPVPAPVCVRARTGKAALQIETSQGGVLHPAGGVNAVMPFTPFHRWSLGTRGKIT